jgi:hypothetical protein
MAKTLSEGGRDRQMEEEGNNLKIILIFFKVSHAMSKKSANKKPIQITGKVPHLSQCNESDADLGPLSTDCGVDNIRISVQS